MCRGSFLAKEVFFSPEEVIISKTDLKGRITYANRTFCDVSGYELKELIGAPHSCIRHEDMPRAVFKLLWDSLSGRQEVFAYVKNTTKTGGYYWVFAHVTPSFDAEGQVVGYHSSRRSPNRDIIRDVIEPLYQGLLQKENDHTNRKQGLEASYAHLHDVLRSKGCSYSEFIFRLAMQAA